MHQLHAKFETIFAAEDNTPPIIRNGSGTLYVAQIRGYRSSTTSGRPRFLRDTLAVITCDTFCVCPGTIATQ